MDVEPLGVGILPISDAGFVHLGAPVGAPHYVHSENLLNQVSPSLSLVPPVTEALEHYSSMVAAEETLPLAALLGSSQKELSNRVTKRMRENLLERLESVRDKARLNSLTLPHAGDWLQVVPCPALGLQLKAQELRISCLYRLGAPVFPGEGPCVACGQQSDSLGDHAVGCASRGERISRHNHLRDALFTTAVSAQLSPYKEDRALLPGGNARPADVLVPHFAGGRHLAIDITVVSSLQAGLVEGASREPGHALQHRYGEKWRKYGEACQAEGVCFQAIPIEVLGGWGAGDMGEKVVKQLAKALARVGGHNEGDTARHLFQRMSILLMRGNSQLILSRCPDYPQPPVTGVL